MRKLLFALALVVVFVGCSSDGDTNPFGPSNALDLNGHWVGTYNLADNNCPQQIGVPPTQTASGTIVQNGSQLTFIGDSGLQGTGTINTLTGDYSVGPVVITEQGITFSETLSGRAISNNELTVEDRVVVSGLGISCAATYRGTLVRG